jgi:hypothetical protein
MGYGLLADAVVAVHVGFVALVLFGQLVIIAGAALRWGWVRNLWFRVIHLVCIAIVVIESLAGVPCPLTVWEDRLRELAGQSVEEGTFIGRFMHNILFYEAEPWVFTTAYVSFGALVLATFVLAPPRRKVRPVVPQTQPRPSGSGCPAA